MGSAYALAQNGSVFRSMGTPVPVWLTSYLTLCNDVGFEMVIYTLIAGSLQGEATAFNGSLN